MSYNDTLLALYITVQCVFLSTGLDLSSSNSEDVALCMESL